MTDLEAMGLSPDQIEQLEHIARKFTAAGLPTAPGDLARFVFGPTKADLERLASFRLPLCVRIKLAILDALDFIRRLLWAIYHNSGEMVDPDNYGYKGPVSTNHH